MATVLDGKEWILQQLITAKDSGLINIDGNIYMDKKPFIDKEDIVINSITADDEFFQSIILNVNCYVPDLLVNTGSSTVNMPDNARLKVITKEVYKVLKDNTKNKVYRSFIQSTRQEQELTEDSNYMNFQIRLNAINY